MINLTKQQQKLYNELTKRIESFGDNPPEYLLIARFNFINSILVNQFNNKV